jgi:hypothetical protein
MLHLQILIIYFKYHSLLSVTIKGPKAVSQLVNYYFKFFRHLRFLLKSAEELAASKPTLVELQNQATASKAVTGAIQSELQVLSSNQNHDHASAQEERDGRLNET